jgi:hypothetical protein
MIKTSEHEHQVCLLTWANLQAKAMPDLALLFAIPNGGKRHIGVARKLKAEGAKAGIPDLFLPAARNGYNGLFIELKTEKGTVSPNQKHWIAALREQGYQVEVCYGWDAARLVLLEYMSL